MPSNFLFLINLSTSAYFAAGYQLNVLYKGEYTEADDVRRKNIASKQIPISLAGYLLL